MSVMLLAQHAPWANTITEIEFQDSKKDINNFSYNPTELSVVANLITKLPKGQTHQVRNGFYTPKFARLKVRLYFNIPYRTLARILVYLFEPANYSDINVMMLFQEWYESEIDFQTFF
ncbi:hypothetical protein E8E12_010110 [Didymella heteroderae]|uniref:Uncharacterized protein n=1 Tax=Didymella heteroderae TaxID=1769908 RepID=A0A9P5C517_9PLEO|nr:hypothetical protein E8E12_010110 [Didymella heteroderae]